MEGKELEYFFCILQRQKEDARQNELPEFLQLEILQSAKY